MPELKGSAGIAARQVRSLVEDVRKEVDRRRAGAKSLLNDCLDAFEKLSSAVEIIPSLATVDVLLDSL